MMQVIKALTFILVCCSLFSCNGTKDISGRYRSNFAVHGFFVTRINLNPDSTFGYRMSGDLIFDTSSGHYKLTKDHLTLHHEPFQPDTSDYAKYGKGALIISHALSANNHLNSPGKYIVGRKKLFVCDSTGSIIKKQFGYSKHRQYLVFGKKWYKRRYFLSRVD